MCVSHLMPMFTSIKIRPSSVKEATTLSIRLRTTPNQQGIDPFTRTSVLLGFIHPICGHRSMCFPPSKTGLPAYGTRPTSVIIRWNASDAPFPFLLLGPTTFTLERTCVNPAEETLRGSVSGGIGCANESYTNPLASVTSR